jgi:hypothetical protein
MTTMTAEEVVKEIDHWEQKFVDLFIESVKQKTPVLTGTLRDGWEGSVESGSYSFSNPVDYAAYVEYGTEYQAPVGMLSTTLQETELLMEQAKRGTAL